MSAPISAATISRVLNESLGEAIHTALRKTTSHPEAAAAYEAIRKLPTVEWRRIIQFAAFGISDQIQEALEEDRRRSSGF